MMLRFALQSALAAGCLFLSACASCGDGGTDDLDDGSSGAGGDETSGSSGATTACREYDPGESGGVDFSSLLTEEQIESLDLTIPYPDAPIAALDVSAAYLGRDDLLRITLTGLVEDDPERRSTPMDFRDIPLAGLDASSFAVEVDGDAVTPSRVTCSGSGDPITVVFLIDVTGSMTPVIRAVRDSLVDFVETATALGLEGRVGVVTYQDTVGVNVPFEDCSGVDGPIPERSPFFPPVSLDDAAGVEGLRAFIGALHADGGNDAPENLAAAVDFAANNVIGYDENGAPNVIDGKDDPPMTSAWPTPLDDGLTVYVAMTDITFHRPDTTSESLQPAFRPRDLREILGSLDGAVVGTIDPAIVDEKSTFSEMGEAPDADFWSRYTGGFGVDRHNINLGAGFQETVSFFDLELLVVGAGLLEIPLAPALASTCVIELTASKAPGSVGVTVTHEAGVVAYDVETQIVPD